MLWDQRLAQPAVPHDVGAGASRKLDTKLIQFRQGIGKPPSILNRYFRWLTTQSRRTGLGLVDSPGNRELTGNYDRK
jgi:hypothetical protein